MKDVKLVYHFATSDGELALPYGSLKMKIIPWKRNRGRMSQQHSVHR
jgi:hypothetical protein